MAARIRKNTKGIIATSTYSRHAGTLNPPSSRLHYLQGAPVKFLRYVVSGPRPSDVEIEVQILEDIPGDSRSPSWSAGDHEVVPGAVFYPDAPKSRK